MQLVVIGEPQQQHHLTFCPLQNQSPSYLKETPFLQEKIDFLSQKDLKESLKEKKIIPIHYDGFFDIIWSESKEFENKFSFFLVVFAAVSFVYGLFLTLFYKDPFPSFFPTCDFLFSYQLNDTRTGEIVQPYLELPCYLVSYVPQNKREKTFSPLFLISFLWAAIAFRYLAKYSTSRSKIKEIHESIIQKNLRLEHILNNLEQMSDETHTASPRDIALSYPFLSDAQLLLLNFAQLNRARKECGELFQEHLKSSKFSKQQLCIFRLYDHIINADNLERLEILKQPYAKSIIGSDPKFFEKIVVAMHPLDPEEKEIFTSLLKTHILTDNFSCDLIEKLTQGHKLKNLFKKSDENAKTENEVFRKFLKNGKLTLHHLDEVFEYIKLAIQEERNDVKEWLEEYIAKNISTFDFDNIESFLLKIKELNLEKLKYKIDQHVADEWNEPKENVLSLEDFEDKFKYAKKHDFEVLKHSIKLDFRKYIREYEITDLQDAKELSRGIIQLLEVAEYIFEGHDLMIRQQLWDKVSAFLKAQPERIEEFGNAAIETKNQWLVDLIKHVYNENPEMFDVYWLTPFEDADLKEVVVLGSGLTD